MRVWGVPANVVEQGADDARLADPGLADEQYTLPLAAAGLPPALQQAAPVPDRARPSAGAAARPAPRSGSPSSFSPVDRENAGTGSAMPLTS